MAREGASIHERTPEDISKYGREWNPGGIFHIAGSGVYKEIFGPDTRAGSEVFITRAENASPYRLIHAWAIVQEDPRKQPIKEKFLVEKDDKVYLEDSFAKQAFDLVKKYSHDTSWSPTPETVNILVEQLFALQQEIKNKIQEVTKDFVGKAVPKVAKIG